MSGGKPPRYRPVPPRPSLDTPLPEGWERVTDPESGNYFFGDTVTQYAQFDDPRTDLLTGRFYAPSKEVWKEESATITNRNWARFQREEKKLNFETKSISARADLGNWYKATRNHAEDSSVSVASSNTSRSTPNTEQKNLIWKEDIAGNPIDAYAQGAHNLPAGVNDHEAWFNVAAAAVGIGIESDLQIKLKSLRGSKKRSEDGEKKRKFSHEGVVHFVTNRIYLTHQKVLMDGETPCILIVPIKTVDEVRDWDGKGYEAIVLAGPPKRDTALQYEVNAARVYKKGEFNIARRKNIAKIGDVKLACSLLKTSVLALAEMVKGLQDKELEGLNENTKKQLKNNRDKIGAEVLVPAMIDEDADELPDGIRVFKATFTGHDCNEGHPAPDPLLLAFKAANIFGRMTGLKLLTNGEIPDPFGSEQHIMAVEKYLDWYQNSLKNVSREELARGLSQAAAN